MRKVGCAEREVNEIRLQIYEETKHMTAEERLERSNRNGDELAKKYGLRIVSEIE
jgi:hypothetical protein